MIPLPLRLLTPLALLILLGGCNSKADTAAEVPLPRPVLAAKVEAAGTQQSAYTGVVAARTESDLGFRVSGKVIDRKVDPGQHVSRGDTLLVLDIGDFELALRSARNRVNAAQAQVRQRRDDENRYQRLASTGAVSRQIFDQSATNLRVAEAELASAQSDASQIENRRAYSVLKADGDGIITDVRVDRGRSAGGHRHRPGQGRRRYGRVEQPDRQDRRRPARGGGVSGGRAAVRHPAYRDRFV